MSNATHGGKGDRQRSKDTNKFNTNWDLIFNNKENKDDKSDYLHHDYEDTSGPKEVHSLDGTGNRNNEEQV